TSKTSQGNRPNNVGMRSNLYGLALRLEGWYVRCDKCSKKLTTDVSLKITWYSALPRLSSFGQADRLVSRIRTVAFQGFRTLLYRRPAGLNEGCACPLD